MSNRDDDRTADARIDGAAAAAVGLLSTAIATWFERTPRSGEITRVVLLHDWPVNEPFPPALVARNGSFVTGDDVYEFFEHDPEIEAWFVPRPRELRTPEMRACARVLNAWFMGADPERSPFDLFVQIARAARREIEERTGSDVWIVPLPLDKDWADIELALTALPPPNTCASILDALRAARGEANG